MRASINPFVSLRVTGKLLRTVALFSALVCGGAAIAENGPRVAPIETPDARVASLTLGGTVQAIAIAPNGDVYAGGSFKNGAGNPDIDFIARWNGTIWQPLGKGLASGANTEFGGVFAIAFDGSKMYVGGRFDSTGDGVDLNNFARWDTTTKTWEPLMYPCSIGMCGPGMKTGYVYALAKPLSGSGVFVGGSFEAPFLTSSATKRVALYDGSAWNALGGIDSGTVAALYVDPLSGDLYAGGENLYSLATSQSTTLFRWDGSAWQGIQNAPLREGVYGIAGTSDSIYIGGYFEIPVGFTGTGDIIYASHTAKWDRANWSPLGAATPIGGRFPYVWALAISGPNVYVGGPFSDPRIGMLSHRFARWNGTSWGNTGAFLDPTGGAVNTIAVSGNQVYIGGSFSNAGRNDDADYIARYNGTSWSALVNPSPTPFPPPVVKALGASGRRGTRIGLRYRVVYVGLGTSEIGLVFKKSRLVRRITGRFAPRRPRVIYSLPLNTTGLQRGAYRYCIGAVDNYSRRSKNSCAPLTIR